MSFDWPWPPVYGGVIDVYHRVDALLARGVHVRLHVVAADDRASDCPAHWRVAGIEVFYHRRRGAWSALSRKPYIVASRQVGSLLPNLANGADVILFEGTHCTGWLGHPRLGDRAQWIRVHNVEADYYAQLAAAPGPLARRCYYREEARRLRRYERSVLAQADLLLPISVSDEDYCEALAPGRVFGQRGYTDLGAPDVAPGLGNYALFHGGLHVADNAAAALDLARLFSARLPGRRLVIAGRRPSASLREALATCPNVELRADPPAREMRELIRGAQVVVLRTGHAAGLKIKLLETLALARHVVADGAMLRGAPRLSPCVTVVEDDGDFAAAVETCWGTVPSPKALEHRRELLRPYGKNHLADALVERLREETFKRN